MESGRVEDAVVVERVDRLFIVLSIGVGREQYKRQQMHDTIAISSK